MKSLQIFLNENLDYHMVNEGEIWDAIKDWFKKLFEPSDKAFDRYDPENKIAGSKLENYKKYLKEKFNIKNLTLKKIPKSDLKNVVYPNGEEPNEDGEIGFYNFIDNVTKEKDNTEYFGLIYEDLKVKDVICLINCIHSDKIIEILNLQIISEYLQYINLVKVIKLLRENKKFKQDANQLIIKETTNKELYKQLINDCEFESEYDKKKNVNIAKKSL